MVSVENVNDFISKHSIGFCMLINDKIKISNSKNSLVMHSELQVKKKC